MAESQIVSTLRIKRDEIECLIGSYEEQLDLARRSLTHVTATLALFEAGSKEQDVTSVESRRFMAREEAVATVKAGHPAQAAARTLRSLSGSPEAFTKEDRSLTG